MKILQIKSIFLLLTFSALLAQPLQATIEKVKLQAGATSIAQNLSREMQINNSNSNNSSQLGLVSGIHRLPFVISVNHLVTLNGDWLNTCDRVEIVNAAGNTLQTLRDAALTKTTVNGKGQLKFTVPSTRLTSIVNFEIRVRYAPEFNGYDVLKCCVVPRGVINSITWVGTNLPTITNVTGGELSSLTCLLEYKLQFTGTGLGSALSLIRTPIGISLGVTSALVNPTGTILTITMKPPSVSLTKLVTPDLQDFVNGNNFEIIGLSGLNTNPFGAYLIYDFNNLLSTTGNLTNLKQLAVNPRPLFPDLRIFPEQEVTAFPLMTGTSYKFGSLTVTDQQGRSYKNILIPTTPVLCDLGTQLITPNAIIGNTSRCVSKELGTDPTLGVVTLHQITMGNYTIPIQNVGEKSVTSSFTNSFRGNMVASTPQVLPTQAALTRFTTFPSITTVTRMESTLNISNTINSIIPKRMIQVFTFSNRPGAFYCDNAWPLEIGNVIGSLITVTIDINNNVNEGTAGGELNNLENRCCANLRCE
jgi:hypothetical protein